MSKRTPYACFVLSRWATVADQRRMWGLKESDHVVLTASHRVAVDHAKAVAFISRQAAERYRAALPARLDPSSWQVCYASGSN